MQKKYLFFIGFLLSFSANCQSHFAGGNGTLTNPWQISNPVQFDNLIKYYNGNAGQGQYFNITASFSMEDFIHTTYGLKGWIPTDKPFIFKGHLDGKGHVISGIWKTDTNQYQGGIIACLETDASITHLGVIIDEKGIEGRFFSGGLVAVNQGTIQSCFTTGGSISSYYQSIGIGGIAGINNGTIQQCYSDCTVKGENSIIHSHAIPPGIGGLAGVNEGTIKASYSRSLLSSYYEGGGFTGLNSSIGIITACYFDSIVCPIKEGIGKDLNRQETNLIPYTTVEMKQKNSFVNWNFDSIWKIANFCSFPLLQWQEDDPNCHSCDLQGEGTKAHPYLINSEKNLLCLQEYLGNKGKNIHFLITRNLDLRELITESYPTKGWYPIGSGEPENPETHFEGIIHGDGHTIKGLWINRPTETSIGLLGTLGAEGVIENLGIYALSVKGLSKTGLLAGINLGQIQFCFADGHVESIQDQAGGITGLNKGLITQCYSMGKTKGNNRVGGIAGLNHSGSIIECYSTCNLSEASGLKGGITGEQPAGTLSKSYYDLESCGVSEIGTPLSKTQMTLKNSFNAWNFTDVWRMMEQVTTPLLFWQACNTNVPLNGDITVYNGNKEYIYQTSPNQALYTWSIEGGTIQSGQGTSSVSVLWHTVGTQRISVNYRDENACFSFSPPVLSVKVNKCSPSISIIGNNTANNAGIFTYTTKAGKSNYQWNVTEGTILSEKTTNTLSVRWNTLGAQKVSVNYTDENGCTPSNPASLNITVQSCEPKISINGPLNTDRKYTENVYTTQSGKLDYTWTVSDGGTITAGENTNQIKVTWNTAGNNSVSVNYIEPNACKASKPSTLNVYTNPDYYAGIGTETDPYQIRTAADLDYLRNYVGARGEKKYFKIMNDIDLTSWSWIPIGNFSSASFQGKLDGNLCRIRGLTIHDWGNGYYANYGLFRALGPGAFIKNLRIIDFYIDVQHGNYIGALAGRNEGGTVVNCFSNGVVKGNNFVGGLIGENRSGTLKYCRAYLNDDNFLGNENVGGLVGSNSGTITSCYASGSIHGNYQVGGLVGSNYGSISYSCAFIDLSGNDQLGGLVGYSSCAITHCYSMGMIYGDSPMTGGFIGQNDDFIQFCYSACKFEIPDIEKAFVGGGYGYAYDLYFDAEIINSDFGFFDKNNHLLIGEYSNSMRYLFCWNTGWASNPSVSPYSSFSWQQHFTKCNMNWTTYSSWTVNTDPYPLVTDYNLYLAEEEEWHYRTCSNANRAAKMLSSISKPTKTNKNQQDQLKKENLLLYPNPTSGKVCIITPEPQLSVKMYNVNGVLLMESKERNIDLSTFPSGIYFINVNGKTQKLIKK